MKYGQFIKIHYPGWDNSWDRYFPVDDVNLANLPDRIEVGSRCSTNYSGKLEDVVIIEVYEGIMIKNHYAKDDEENEDHDFWTKQNTLRNKFDDMLI